MSRGNELLWRRLSLIPEMRAASTHLRQCRVLVVGADSLGAAIAVHLACCGIRHLTLVDGDMVGACDIRHSSVFRLRHVGRSKAEVVRWKLRAKFPGIEVAVERRSIEQCSPALFQEHDLIVCTSDENRTRRWVNSWAVQWSKPALFIGSGGAQMWWVGYIFLYHPGEGACFVCFDSGGKEPEADEAISTGRAPNTAFEAFRRKYEEEEERPTLLLVGVISSYAAALALKRLADVVPTPTYTLLDLKQPRLFAHDFPPIPSCSVCGHLTK